VIFHHIDEGRFVCDGVDPTWELRVPHLTSLASFVIYLN
jgi:hypothetical protein